MAEPPKVIHVRYLASDTTEDDLVELVKPFGAVAEIKMLRANNQAFLLMEHAGASTSAVEHYTRVQANIKGRNVYLQLSSYQDFAEHDQVSQGSTSDQESQPSRILFVSFRNMNYPITVEVLHQVFSVQGFVEKIVICQKSAGFKALVQYQSQENAIEAKDALQERNIYDGCCNLDIQFSKKTELGVKYNDDTSRNFRDPSLPTYKRRRPSQVGDEEGLPTGITGTNHKCTIFAANLERDKIDENKLFNLFSFYGNVIRILIPPRKSYWALIEMADGFQAELAVYFLKGSMLFGKPLHVTYSKYEHVRPSPDTHEFAGSNLNRFNVNSNTVKNYSHCCAPTKMIHVFSLPRDITQEKLLAHLEGFGTIVNSMLFQVNKKKQALIMFEKEAQAIEALVCKHGTTIGQSTIRLSFSQLKTIRP